MLSMYVSMMIHSGLPGDTFSRGRECRNPHPATAAGCRIIAAMNEPFHPVQIEGFRRMTPAQKLQMVADLYHAGIQLKVAGLRMTHPDWSEERLDLEARRSLLYAGPSSRAPWPHRPMAAVRA